MTENSQERVSFFLAGRYFTEHNSQSGMCGKTCMYILERAFGMNASESLNFMKRNRNGFEIICRPDQFARFIILRSKHGNCINGIKDLDPKLFIPYQSMDIYEYLACKTCSNMPSFQIKKLTAELGLSRKDLQELVENTQMKRLSDRSVDVCNRPYIADGYTEVGE